MVAISLLGTLSFLPQSLHVKGTAHAVGHPRAQHDLDLADLAVHDLEHLHLLYGERHEFRCIGVQDRAVAQTNVTRVAWYIGREEAHHQPVVAIDSPDAARIYPVAIV